MMGRRRMLVGLFTAAVGGSAIAPRAHAADQMLVKAAVPVEPVPTAATVGGEPTAVLGNPGTAFFQLSFRDSPWKLEGHDNVPSGVLSFGGVVARRVELSFAVAVIPLDAVYGPSDARLGARIGLYDEGDLRVALLGAVHAGLPVTIRQVYAADAGLAWTYCHDQTCRASLTMFGSVDRHRVGDWASDENAIHFDRSQAAGGGSAILPFSAWGSVFASGRASTTFGCSAEPSSSDPCARESTLLTASAGARIASRGGHVAFDLATTVIRGQLEEFNSYQKIPYALFIGGTFTVSGPIGPLTTAPGSGQPARPLK